MPTSGSPYEESMISMDRAQLVEQIKELIVRELDLRNKSPNDIGDDQQLFGGGLALDSLDALQLAVALEERFKVKLPEGDAAREVFASVATIATFILKSDSAR